MGFLVLSSSWLLCGDRESGSVPELDAEWHKIDGESQLQVDGLSSWQQWRMVLWGGADPRRCTLVLLYPPSLAGGVGRLPLPVGFLACKWLKVAPANGERSGSG